MVLGFACSRRYCCKSQDHAGIDGPSPQPGAPAADRHCLSQYAHVYPNFTIETRNRSLELSFDIVSSDPSCCKQNGYCRRHCYRQQGSGSLHKTAHASCTVASRCSTVIQAGRLTHGFQLQYFYCSSSAVSTPAFHDGASGFRSLSPEP